MNLKSSNKLPAADSFINPVKSGVLLKKSGKRFLRPSKWQNKFCIIDDYKLFFYESQNSNGRGKNCGLINLKYFDCVSANEADGENTSKKNKHVFAIHQSDKLGFFDIKHVFSAESKEDVKQWVSCINNLFDEISVNNKGSLQRSAAEYTRESRKRRSVTLDRITCNEDKLKPVTKDRVKGPKGRRLPNRKSEFPRSAESLSESGTSANNTTDGMSDATNDHSMDYMDEDDTPFKDSSSDISIEKNMQQNNVYIPKQDVAYIRPNQVKESASQKVEHVDIAIENTKVDNILELVVTNRQTSVASNRSARSSDPTSTYQLYLLDKDMKSLRRDVNSLQMKQAIEKPSSAHIESINKQIVKMQSEINCLRTDMDMMGMKISQVLTILSNQLQDHPDDTLI